MNEPQTWDQTGWPPFNGICHADVAHYMELLWSKSLEDIARLIMHLERQLTLQSEQTDIWRCDAEKLKERLKPLVADHNALVLKCERLQRKLAKLKPKRKKKANGSSSQAEA